MEPHDAHPSPSPTRQLLVVLCVSLVVLVSLSLYAVHGMRELRELQTRLTERNRKDTLQLLRIQNGLFAITNSLRDVVPRADPYAMTAWRNMGDRLRQDLDEAVALERQLAPPSRPLTQQQRFDRAMDRYWVTLNRSLSLAQANEERAAADLIRTTLADQQRELVDLVADFLFVNNRMDEEAAAQATLIYQTVERQLLLFGGALVLAFAVGGIFVVARNRRAFEDVRRLTDQLRGLSWRMMRMQEELQQEMSRELHDEFSQILTAIGTLLGRAKRTLPANQPLLVDLEEVRSIAQTALQKVRTQSRLLHPAILHDFGLEHALNWYVEQFGRQSGLVIHLVKEGALGDVSDDAAIHIYRIVQEALSNISRHSGSKVSWVRLRREADELILEVEDRGRGLGEDHANDVAGGHFGLISMRERAELMGGHLALHAPPEGGLIVRARLPLREISQSAPSARAAADRVGEIAAHG